MYKTLMLALLLLSAAWSQALQDTASNSGQNAGTPSPDTIEGCLQMDNGEYTLADNTTGTVTRLSGAGKKLKPQVGHQVELTGKPSWRTLDATLAGGASNVKTQYVFEVKSVKRTADDCKTY